MIGWLIIGALCAVLLLVAWRSGSGIEADDVDRPGDDEQWTDLADAMRRYRKHKARGRHRAV